MTTKTEGRQALFNARQFMLSLLNPKATPGVPRAVRQGAAHALRHYPWGETPDELFSAAMRLREKVKHG